MSCSVVHLLKQQSLWTKVLAFKGVEMNIIGIFCLYFVSCIEPVHIMVFITHIDKEFVCIGRLQIRPRSLYVAGIFTLIRHESGAFRKRSSNQRNLTTPALVWTENILKTELYENYNVIIIMRFLKQRSKMTDIIAVFSTFSSVEWTRPFFNSHLIPLGVLDLLGVQSSYEIKVILPEWPQCEIKILYPP